jgi:hypothetical protein
MVRIAFTAAMLVWSSGESSEADAYLKQNVFTKQKLVADFVATVPYGGKSQNKTCCTFCEAGLHEPVSQNVKHVLQGSGFEQNVHKKIKHVLYVVVYDCCCCKTAASTIPTYSEYSTNPIWLSPLFAYHDDQVFT